MRKFNYEINPDQDILINEIIAYGEQEATFKIRIEDNNFCCGIVELGSFEIELFSDYDYGSLVNNADFCRQLDLALKAFCRTLKSGKKGSKEKERCMTTLINSDDCNLLRDSFVRTGLFREVDSFINKNSGNKVTIWLSI